MKKAVQTSLSLVSGEFPRGIMLLTAVMAFNILLDLSSE